MGKYLFSTKPPWMDEIKHKDNMEDRILQICIMMDMQKYKIIMYGFIHI
jgi:hypothetical protein